MGPQTDTTWRPKAEQETLTSRALRTTAAEAKAKTLEAELASMREKLANRETQIQSLTISLELQVKENVQLLGRIAEHSAALNEAETRLHRLEQVRLAEEADRNEILDNREAQIRSLNTQLDAMSFRAVTAERQVQKTFQRLLWCYAHNNDAERAIGQAESLVQEHERKIQELTDKQADLVDQLMIRDAALASAEERAAALMGLLIQLEAKLKPLTRQRAVESGRASADAASSGRAAQIIVSERTIGSAALQNEPSDDAWLFNDHQVSRVSDTWPSNGQSRPFRLLPYRALPRL